MDEQLKIPFNVLARTARLIGRENVATAKGALVELVKNCYDADASSCIVYFDNYYANIRETLTSADIEELKKNGIPHELLESMYDSCKDEENNSFYRLVPTVDDSQRKQLLLLQRVLCAIYVLDSGEGMTSNIIKKRWMTIGTDDKAKFVRSRNGRIKTGAKGIGRFALDRLGGRCTMYTKFDSSFLRDLDDNEKQTEYCGYVWEVNWGDFDNDTVNIGDITASLGGQRSMDLVDFISIKHMPKDLCDLLRDQDVEHGTLLKISDLRDDWKDYFVLEVYSDLENLVPPTVDADFSIYLYSSDSPSNYGKVSSFICEDYDYRVKAVSDGKQNVSITISRKEQDVDLMPPDLFSRPFFCREPFTQETFRRGEWHRNLTYDQLLPTSFDLDYQDAFGKIGPFEFNFYYLKKVYSRTDARRFFYRTINSKSRQTLLANFGGIKLFRDNFRVRPYGEIGNAAFDWLGLGLRKSKSPAGVAKKGGGYKVEPDNVMGNLSISRLVNINFEDKSSREGLIENNTFLVFKQLICAIIAQFERDRAAIAEQLKIYDDERYGDARAKEKAKEAALTTLNAKRDVLQSLALGIPVDGVDEKDLNLALMALLNKEQEELIAQLHEEQKVLRVLASSGIVLASFSHDLSHNNMNLGTRYERLRSLLLERISDKDYIGVEDRKNPFYRIENMRKDDVKLENWLAYSLNVAKKDRRKRSDLQMYPYFRGLKEDWLTNLQVRGISLNFECIPADLTFRAFAIDFDSIFHNLLVNSVDAFILSKEDRAREINIVAKLVNGSLEISYSDSGPGLSPKIVDPYMIFEPLFTTKRNLQTGEESGTGLGMWILKSIVDEYGGNLELLFPVHGFSIRITFPIS